MEWIASPEAWVALATLTVLEIVLGIDNIIFISILVGRLPEAQRQRARIIGLGIAMGARILLLLLITWIMRLQATLFTVFGVEISGRDLILVGGGLFLLAKATLEIHTSLEGETHGTTTKGAASFFSVIVQIGIIDIVFSLDSVITAVGMADDVAVMIIAIVLAIGVMIGRSDRAFCRSASDRQNAGIELSRADRLCAHRRGPRSAYTERLHLFCDGLLGRGRDAESAAAPESPARAFA